MRSARGVIVLLIGIAVIVSSSYGQVEKKISFDILSGISFLPFSEKTNSAGLPTDIFGKFHPAFTSGIGVNYKMSQRSFLSGRISNFNSSKPHYRIGSLNAGISLKYFPLTIYKNVSPYFKAGININMVSLSRDKYDLDFYPDSSISAIWPGVGVKHITYHFEQLKLQYVPLPGTTIGAGVTFKVSDPVNIFIEYNYNYNLATISHLFKDNYSYNKSNFKFGFVGAGVTIKLLKPSKQLLAELKREQWDGDPTVTIKGTIVYKNPSKAKEKIISVEMVNSSDSVLNELPSDKKGIFGVEKLTSGDYKFMLEKRDKRILKANLEIVHDSRMNIFDDYPSLEMPDDFDTDNLISRDNNFSIVLREGFQHEVDVTILGNSLSGKVLVEKKDTSCRHVMVFVKDSKDSIIAVTKPDDDCSFSFDNLPEGDHKIVFVNQSESDSSLSFSYEFKEPSPIIKRQFNTDEDSALANYDGEITVTDNSNINIDDILLYSKYEKRQDREENINLTGNKVSGNSDVLHNSVQGDSLTNDQLKKEDQRITNNNNTISDDSGYKDPISSTTNSNVNKNLNSNNTGRDLSADRSVSEKDTSSSIYTSSITSERTSILLTHFQIDKTYDVNGEEKTPKGYGIQIGAFRSIENARRESKNLSKKLTKQVFIQVIGVKKDGFVTKMYRVIVGEFENKEAAQSNIPGLNKLGYKEVLIKKF